MDGVSGALWIRAPTDRVRPSAIGIITYATKSTLASLGVRIRPYCARSTIGPHRYGVCVGTEYRLNYGKIEPPYGCCDIAALYGTPHECVVRIIIERTFHVMISIARCLARIGTDYACGAIASRRRRSSSSGIL